MSRLDQLRKNYQRLCGLPWDDKLAGPQRVWMAVYDKEDERKLRLRIGLFEEATHHARHRWEAIDLTDALPDWLCSPPYQDYAASYFESPTLLGKAPLAAFKNHVAGRINQVLDTCRSPEETVVAVYGIASLFGFVRVSEVIPLVESHIKGRLLVLFPGVYEQNNYRMLDARDGWNYLAIPITSSEGQER
jgi:hypothetical protein